MTEDKEKIMEACQDEIAARLAQMIAGFENISPIEAIRRFMSTMTYDLLMETKSRLHRKSVGYVLDMYDAELCGDWDRWMEI